MSEHYIEKCSVCGTVISQCRCPDPNKAVRYSVCSDCGKPLQSPFQVTDKLLDSFQVNNQLNLTDHESAVIALRRHHSNTWRTEPPEYWLSGLKEELEELEGVLNGTHEDDLIWELAQIAAIAMNWIEMEVKNIIKPQ